MKLLLQEGADVNLEGGQYGCPLQAALATYKNSDAVIKLLLDNGADIKAVGGEYSSVLQAAVYRDVSY
jgi:hypothetical protein